MALDKTDIRALRNADTICFDYREGEHAIRAILREEHSSTGYEQTRRIVVGGRVTYYEGEHSKQFPAGGTCYESVMYAGHDLPTLTWLGFLREGDEIELHWLGGNNSQTMTSHGLAQDELSLRIKRERANRQYEFHIDSRLCPVDSTARMVRPY